MLADLRFAASTDYVDGGTTEDGKAYRTKAMWVYWVAPWKINGTQQSRWMEDYYPFQLGDVLKLHVNFQGRSDIHQNVSPPDLRIKEFVSSLNMPK